jgi:hypothetical protein
MQVKLKTGLRAGDVIEVEDSVGRAFLFSGKADPAEPELEAAEVAEVAETPERPAPRARRKRAPAAKAETR